MTRTARRDAAILAAVLGLAIVLRAPWLDLQLWFDELQTVGIARRSLWDIPGTLRLDGSPPLFYVLLHVWMKAFGTGAVALHALTALLGVAAAAVAWACARRLGGTTAAVLAAALTAASPLLVASSAVARMQTLLALIAWPTALWLVRVVDEGRGRIQLGLLSALLLYTHTWAIYAAGAMAVAFAVLGVRESRLWRDGAVAMGIAGVLYLPWLPTLLFQAEHTGAPWSPPPGVGDVRLAVVAFAGGYVALGLAVVAAALLAVRPEARPAGRGWAALVLVPAVATGCGLIAARFVGSWSPEFTVVVLPFALLAAALAGARSRAVAGLFAVATIAMAVVALQPSAALPWFGEEDPLPALLREAPLRGDRPAVVLANPDDTVVAHWFLRHRSGDRYVTYTGPVADPAVEDWRDQTERMRRAYRGLARATARDAPAGTDLVLVAHGGFPDTAWGDLLDRATRAWAGELAAAPDLRRRWHRRVGVRTVTVYTRR